MKRALVLTLTIGSLAVMLSALCSMPSGAQKKIGGGGDEGGAVCSVSPNSLTFPTTPVGLCSAFKTFVITNTGSGTLTGTIVVPGPDFHLYEGSPSYNLTAGQSRTFKIVFGPQGAGPKSCTIETGNAQCVDVYCSGTGGSVGQECPPGFVSMDGPNPGDECPGPWGAACGGSYLDTRAADGNTECIQDVILPCVSGPFLEWIWVFDNVPAGNRFLTFSGSIDGPSTIKYQFMYQFQQSSECCPVHQYVTSDSLIVGSGETTMHLGPSPTAGRVCVLLRTKTSHTTPLMVYVDLLRIDTQ